MWACKNHFPRYNMCFLWIAITLYTSSNSEGVLWTKYSQELPDHHSIPLKIHKEVMTRFNQGFRSAGTIHVVPH